MLLCRGPHAVAAMAAGLVCYYLGSMANFYALTLIDASVERALLFTYPALVVLLGVLLGLERLRKSTLAALLATFSGIALVMGVDSTDGLDTDLTGALWVFFLRRHHCHLLYGKCLLKPQNGQRNVYPTGHGCCRCGLCSSL